MSTLPQSARIFSPAAVTAPPSDTSTACAQALRPSARISAATFSEFSCVRDTTTTSAPSAANFKAMARPTLRHRVALRPEAELEGASADGVLDGILAAVPVPRW